MRHRATGGCMRSLALLSLTAFTTAMLGCGSERREQVTASIPDRDITRPAPAPEVEIVSPVELRQRPAHQTIRPARSPRRPAAPRPAAPRPASAESGRTLEIAARPALMVTPPITAAEPANDRELLPGKTITLIPASSGPSAEPSWNGETPTVRGGAFVVRGGGRCPRRGRGPGIGIATAPRPDFR